MRHSRKPIAELFRILPRLTVMLLVVAAPALAVGTGNASGDSIYSSEILVGSDLATPNGVGLVLAVGLQRNQ